MDAQRKRLFIVRHCEAGHAAKTDFERGLTEAGSADAAKLGAELENHQISFDAALASSAVRASLTLDAMLGELKEQPQKLVTRKLYRAGALEWLQTLQGLPETVRDVLIVGHNPALSELGTFLLGKYVKLAPGDMRVLEYANAWETLDEGRLREHSLEERGQ